MKNVQWPDVFHSPELIESRDPELLFADALVAWGNCMAGNYPPKSFGEVLVKISDKLGMKNPPTANGFHQHGIEMRWIKEDEK